MTTTNDISRMPLRQSVAVLIPVYNAGERLRPVVEKTLQFVDTVIVVDDGSTDGCIDSIRNLDVVLERFPKNRGKGHALIRGFERFTRIDGREAVCVIDADGQHDPQELPRFYDAFHQYEADLVVGVRVFSGEQVPWRSRFGNELTARLTRMLLGAAITDTQSGYRLHSRHFAGAIAAEVPGGRYETEMEILVKALRDKLKVVPVPISTLYEPGNPSSHFDKIGDSARIYSRLLKSALLPRRR